MKCPFCKEEIADGSKRCKICQGDIAKQKSQQIAGKVMIGFILLIILMAIIGSFTGSSGGSSVDPDYKACRDKYRLLGGDDTEAGKSQNTLCSNMLRNTLTR